jgi:trehalose 6-phosphate phosphatase
VDLRALDPFAAEPERSALLFDVDGTLAPIVVDPESAAVPAATRELLEALVGRYALVACISGRQALEARRIVGIDSIAYVGNHGLELLAPGAGEPVTDPALEPLAGAAGSFVRSAYGPHLEKLGVRIEDKDAIWSLHWRGAPDEEAVEEALRPVATEAERQGLVPHWGRKILEIRPPFETDKGTAVAAALDHHRLARALYAGDDTTDLDAFRKLRALEDEGRLDALCVGVRSAEGPEAIEREADLVVDGPEAMSELLEALT